MVTPIQETGVLLIFLLSPIKWDCKHFALFIIILGISCPPYLFQTPISLVLKNCSPFSSLNQAQTCSGLESIRVQKYLFLMVMPKQNAPANLIHTVCTIFLLIRIAKVSFICQCSKVIILVTLEKDMPLEKQ